MKLIIWRRQEFIDDLPEEITGLYIVNYYELVFYQRNKERLKDSFSAWYKDYLLYPKYYGEPQVTKWGDSTRWGLIGDKPIIDFGMNCLVDEPSLKLLEIYKNHICSITFSAYRNYFRFLENWFGWRIPVPFSNQIKIWEELEKLYPVRFQYVWIKINNNNLQKVISWAKNHNKHILIYANEKMSKNQYDRYLKKFIDVFRRNLDEI